MAEALATQTSKFPLPDRFCIEIPSQSTKTRKRVKRLYLHIESVAGAGDRYLVIDNEYLNSRGYCSMCDVPRILGKLASKEWVMSKSTFKDKLPRDHVTEYLDDGRRAIGYQWAGEEA